MGSSGRRWFCADDMGVRWQYAHLTCQVIKLAVILPAIHLFTSQPHERRLVNEIRIPGHRTGRYTPAGFTFLGLCDMGCREWHEGSGPMLLVKPNASSALVI